MLSDASGGSPSTNGGAAAAPLASAAAAVSSSAASSVPLPGYYTAYLAQQQQQHSAHAAAALPAAAGGYSYPPGCAHPYAYGSYPQQQPAPSHTAAAPPPAEAAASTNTAAAPSAASTADAAAYTEYQRAYYEWYQQHYLPHAMAAAQAQQQPHYTAYSAAPTAPTTSQTTPASTPYSSAHTHPSAAQHAHTAQQQPVYPPQYSYRSNNYPYPPHPAQTPHPPASTAPASHSSPPAPSAQPSANASHLPLPPPASTSRRSRWSAEPPPPSSAPPHPSSSSTTTFSHPSPPSSSAASPSPSTPADAAAIASAWPPSVVEYVQRSLALCPAHAKADVERYVRERLQAAVNSGEVHRIDWQSEPLAHVRLLADEIKARRDRGEQAVAAQDERKRIEGERLEWEQRRARQAAAEEERRRQDHANARHAEKGKRDKRSREYDEKRGHESSSSDDEDDVRHFFSSSSSTPHQLSSRERKRERRRLANGGNTSHPKTELSTLDPVDLSRNRDRASRFSAYLQETAAAPMKSRIRTDLFTASQSTGTTSFSAGGEDDDAIDWGALKIVGISTALEKSYFRLTSAPDPSTVRPPHILYQSLARLLSQWRTHAEYAYLVDQMKAIRQDLVVQHVRDAFTVRVYEEHARIAVEVGDLSEYNQCQTQLRMLYTDQDVQGEDARANEVEFVMYRLCYCMVTRNQAALNAMLSELSAQQRAQPAIAHVLDLRKAVAASDFYHFLRAYRRTPYKGVSLLQHLALPMRLHALTVLVRAYKPTRVRLDIFQNALGFDSRAECAVYVTSCGAVISEDGESLLTASSDVHEPEIEEEEKGKDDKHGITHALLSHAHG